MSRRSRWVRGSISLTGAAVALLFAVAARGQSARPTVVTDFVIESPTHVENYKPDAKRREFELEIAAGLARLCQEKFGFLKWIPAGDVGDTLPAAQLTLRLKAESDSRFPAILLDYGGMISGQGQSVALATEQLYGGFDDQRTNEHEVLKHDVNEKLARQFANDSFRHDLHEAFLRHVPLADGVTLHQPQVIVPVNAEELAASHESVLLVVFTSKPNGAAKEGVIELIPIGQEGGSLGCLIRKLLFPTVIVDKLGGWDPSIPTILQPPLVENVKVFMSEYRRRVNPGTEGALSTRPD